MAQRILGSVFYRELQASLPYMPMDRSTGYGGYPFKMAAAAPGKVSIMKVPDMLERQYIIDRMYNDTPVFADDPQGNGGGIANDLVNQWARNTLGPGGNARPGIWVCAGQGPVEAEIQQAYEGQYRLVEWIMLTAEDNWNKGRKGHVTEADREAARWYMAQCAIDQRPIPMAFGNLEWVNVKPGQEMKQIECPMCFKKVDARAAMCPDGHVLDFNRYQQYVVKKQEIDAMLAAYKPPPNAADVAEPPRLGEPQEADAEGEPEDNQEPPAPVSVELQKAQDAEIQKMRDMAAEVLGWEPARIDYFMKTPHTRLWNQSPLIAIKKGKGYRVARLLESLRTPVGV